MSKIIEILLQMNKLSWQTFSFYIDILLNVMKSGFMYPKHFHQQIKLVHRIEINLSLVFLELNLKKLLQEQRTHSKERTGAFLCFEVSAT